MIIKNLTFIFDLLTNKLSRSKAFKTIECSEWTNSNGRALFSPILDCYNAKIIQIVISQSKKSFFFMLIKQNN